MSQSRSRTRRYASMSPCFVRSGSYISMSGTKPSGPSGCQRTRPSATATDRWAGMNTAVSSAQWAPTATERTPPGSSSPATKNSTGSPPVNSWAPSRFTRMRAPKASANRPACR